jgi:hypothetical protein
MGLPVLDGKEEQGEQVNSGIVTRAAKRHSAVTGGGRLAGAGRSEP